MQRFTRSFPIHLSAVDLGCCVPPFSVGQQVDWTLIFISHDLDDDFALDEDDPGLLTRRWRLERSGAGVLVIDGPLAATWATHIAPAPEPGEAELTGILTAVFHGSLGTAVDPPTQTQGVVRRIRVVTRLQQQHAPHLLRWVPSSSWTYDVPSSATTLDQRPPTTLGTTRRVDTGLLVDLDAEGVVPARGRPAGRRDTRDHGGLGRRSNRPAVGGHR